MRFRASLFSKKQKTQMSQQQTVRFAPFRPFNDFVGGAEDYGLPTFNDLVRWNNRVTNNLLYYQSNYFLVILAFFVFIG
jgi:hypothetical protein